jgi:hypothetical protein
MLHTVDVDAAKAVLAAFERAGVRYAIFGAAALNLHGLARFTEDLDPSMPDPPKPMESCSVTVTSASP